MELNQRIAERRVERFLWQFGEASFPLACHAALPLVLTPDLLNYLRTKFLLNEVPYTAEADILLSELCREIGRELYAIDLPVRNYLLQKLKEMFGENRVTEIANFLLSYIHNVSQRGQTFSPDELQAERWTALAYIDKSRGQLVDELVAALWDCILTESDGMIRAVNWSEMARLLTIIEEITPQMADYPELIKYAELTGQVIADQSGERTLELLKTDIFAHEFLLNGKPLPKLDGLIKKKRYTSISAAAIVHNDSWKHLQESFENETPINGTVVGHNTGGLLVDVGGILSFLPGRLVDVRPVGNLAAFRNHQIDALVIEASLEEARVILSRKALIEKSETVAFDKALEGLEEGMIVEGTVVSIADFAAFVNFGSEIDALLHISEMSWGFISHPNSVLEVGQSIEARVITLDRETRTIELSYRALIPNPWLEVHEKYAPGMRVDGTVVGHREHWVLVELASQIVGRIHLSELEDEAVEHLKSELAVGQVLSVLIVRIDSEKGRMLLTLKKSLDEVTDDLSPLWEDLEHAFQTGVAIQGRVVARIKGGLRVDVNGIAAFLPGSQIDLRPVRNLDDMVGDEIEVKIIKINPERSNLVLSRKLILEEKNAEAKERTLSQLEEDMVIEGQIKNLTDYGAFVDIGGLEGLLHVTDMTWGRSQKPTDLFNRGDLVHVKVLKFDRERERVALGYKQLLPDPWQAIEERYQPGQIITGKVSSIVDYGVFIEIEPGVEGLAHASELTWSKRVKHPEKLVSVGETLKAQVLQVQAEERRISLGIKQLHKDPWEDLAARYDIGATVRGRVRNLNDFGAFIELEVGVEGLLHVSDMAWMKGKRINHPGELLKEGEEIEVVIIGIDPQNQKLSLSTKELESTAWKEFVNEHRSGDIVEGKITRFASFGAFVELAEDLEGLCLLSELSEERIEKPEDAVEIGQEFSFRILRIDVENRKIGLSLRAEATEGLIEDLMDQSEESNGG